ncbi:MAG: hypothetical protein ACPL3P_07095 [Anaerolineales bacterium]
MEAYTAEQKQLLDLPSESKIFLEGVAGTGKTTGAVARLLGLIHQGIPPQQILILVPQRTLAQPYYDGLSQSPLPPGGVVNILTIAGLARRLVELYWPIIAESAGFEHPEIPPTFLTLETAQYFMAKLVRPLLDKGYFASLSLHPNRLYSQIIDNLNKAAIIGIPTTEIGERLKSAWSGNPGQKRVYDDVQECVDLFRQFCYEHNLLDYSLQIELFRNHVLNSPFCFSALKDQYRQLIADNIEEDIPLTHEFISMLLPHLDAALLIYDEEGGYRTFLGADPISAYTLKSKCQITYQFQTPLVQEAPLQRLTETFRTALEDSPTSSFPSETRSALQVITQRFYPQMLDLVSQRIQSLIEDDHIPPSEIVVLAPYLSDSLRFTLMNRLESAGVAVRSHRPSRALREEATIRALLTLAILAHPQWRDALLLNKYDVAYAFLQIFSDFDLVRAQLLANSAFGEQNTNYTFIPFEKVPPALQERISYSIGKRYEQLRSWIDAYNQAGTLELEVFFLRLFDDILTQPGFRFYQNEAYGEMVANLIESIRKFRWAIPASLHLSAEERAKEYLQMVQEGVIAAQYVRSWQAQDSNAVLLAPAYTFLLSNRPVDVQIWLDVGSNGWYERLFQPLTHPYVMSRHWQVGKVWTADDEQQVSQWNLTKITLGLLHRCRKMLWIAYSELGESGFEQRGNLLRVFQHTLEALQSDMDYDGI